MRKINLYVGRFVTNLHVFITRMKIVCYSRAGRTTICIADVEIFETRPTGCDADLNCADEINEIVLVRAQPQNQTCNNADDEVTMSDPVFCQYIVRESFLINQPSILWMILLFLEAVVFFVEVFPEMCLHLSNSWTLVILQYNAISFDFNFSLLFSEVTKMGLKFSSRSNLQFSL